MACKSCRERKIRCDRVRPVCKQCRLRSAQCTYVGERRTKQWIRTAGVVEGGNRRPSMIQDRRPSLIHQGSTPPRAGETEEEGRRGRDSQASIQMRMRMQMQRQPHDEDEDGHGDDDDDDCMDTIPPPSATASSCEDGDSLLDRILQGSEAESTEGRTPPAVWMRATDGDEYTGPSSGISTISDLGLRWVRQNVPDSAVLCDTIQDIRNGVLNHLRRPKAIPRDLLSPLAASASPDGQDQSHSQNYEHDYPADDVFRTYVDAYFDNVQVIFPILDRSRFLAQLDVFGTTSPSPSWQALLSAVLASGCRAALSAETADAFRASGREAWRHFLHALSFETRILHGSTDLMAVQAVAVMTVFAQGLSSPQRLEYTLSSVAVRLAQSLALDRAPAPDWHLDASERRERDRVFWAIYCLDRLVSLRCGRPAVIADHDVSCRFPRAVTVHQGTDETSALSPQSSGGPPPVDFFLCIVRLARICGTVSRRLYSAAALCSPGAALLPTLNRLLSDLHAWLNILPPAIRPGKPPNRMPSTFGLSRGQVIVLHLSYYYVLCAAYRRFTPLFTRDADTIRHLLDNNMHPSHVESARAMVLLTKHLDIESFTPAWLVWYYPFTALTTLFVHVVSNPLSSTAQSDIALMETVVGFFGRLEYVTSGEAAFTKTTEFVRQARSVVSARHAQAAADVSISAPEPVPAYQQLTATATAQKGADACRMVGLTPPLSEALRDCGGQDGLGAHGGFQHDENMYGDLAGLLATPAGDSIHVNWMEDLISAV